MTGENYYLLAGLPALGDFATSPPISFYDFRKFVAANQRVAACVRILALEDDLMQRATHLAGEEAALDLLVLKEEELEGVAFFDKFFGTGSAEAAVKFVHDAERLLEFYFRSAAKRALQLHSRFLLNWVYFELDLRRELMGVRAARLGRSDLMREIAPDLKNELDFDFSTITAEWSAAVTPLIGIGQIEMARWAWLTENENWFNFSDDELVAYGAKLLVLHRWQRLCGEGSSISVGQEAAAV